MPQLLSVIWKRRRMSAGYRSRTWLGVSCSSLPRHAGLRHCGHSGTGVLPIRCRYWVEPAQWPALSWWTSTEKKQSRPITGGGTVVPIRWRNQPWGRWLAVRALAILAAAVCTVRVSTGTAEAGRRLGQDVRLLVTVEAAVEGYPLEVDLSTGS